jgi:hypothetical protein
MALCTRTRSTSVLIRAAFAAAIPLALAACAGTGTGPDLTPDKPLRTANVCTDSAIPAGWIRVNDWRGKGCGVEENNVVSDKGAGIQLASAAAPAKIKATPKVDFSRGANAVADYGPNNWMTIAELDRVRIGRSLTACTGPVPEGWTEKTRYWDKGRCGNPTKQSVKNVMLIERAR